MGLIARELEASGIPTVALSSALSITESVGTPRAVFLDYPLGHTAGRRDAPGEQLDITRRALEALATLERPGEVVYLPHVWAADDSWKDSVMQSDDRVERTDQPQYQCAEDRELAAAADCCATCIEL